MRCLLKTLLIFAGITAFVLSQGCSSSTIKDDELSSFMLGGIYFVNGYGGIDATKQMISGAGYTTNEEIVEGYREIFIFPFDTSQKNDIKGVLESWWGITDKESLLKQNEELKTREYKHKAWDYARLVNNTALGYATEYLTKEEATKMVEEILPLAREKYKTWEEYYTDYNLGRQEWDPENDDTAEFESLASDITKGDDSIYTILPLHN